MRLALLADLHANLEATVACLEHARGRGAEGHVFLGDLVGYGADPEAVIELVEAHAARGSLVVAGNHDRAVAEGRTATMDRPAALAAEWTRQRLAAHHRAFLAGLPLRASRGRALFVHASAASPGSWRYVHDQAAAEESLAAAPEATWILSGHVHVPALYHLATSGRAVHFAPVAGVAIPVPPRRRWLGIVGSAGQPRDGSAAACYALLDEDAATLAFFRVPYDIPSAAAKVRAAGLPESLARRLEWGG